MRSSSTVILIPAYRPDHRLQRVVGALLERGVGRIIVVNDGSGPGFAPVFDALRALAGVTVLEHAVNLGKGAALKTAFNHALVSVPGCLGAVTADADGQHDPDDIMAVLSLFESQPDTVVLGSRTFAGPTPLRSRIGNGATRILMNLLVGRRIRDTQTGLRALPARLMRELLPITANGYEFELDVLLLCKHRGVPILEHPIRTIYLEGNRSSHFRPVLDSIRIYFVLFRFTLLALMTALLDNGVFTLVYGGTGNIAESQAVARVLSALFNYVGARSAVFHSRRPHAALLPGYAALVICNAAISYSLICWLSARFSIRPIVAKIVVESILFWANFAIQRDLIFTARPQQGRTSGAREQKHHA